MRFVIDAKGQPSLLGVPSIVKSCSKGDSEIEGIAEDAGAEGLSAEGPECITTPFCFGTPVV